MNPEHLLEQADELLQAPERGAPRQADKRRAVSAAYYALFHALAALIANELIGAVHKKQPRYTLVYRSIEHAKLRALCSDLIKSQPPAKYRAFSPAAGFSTDLKVVANAFVDLQELRHRADYDPSYKIDTATARRHVRRARVAIRRLAKLPAVEHQLFSTLALFEPKR